MDDLPVSHLTTAHPDPFASVSLVSYKNLYHKKKLVHFFFVTLLFLQNGRYAILERLKKGGENCNGRR